MASSRTVPPPAAAGGRAVPALIDEALLAAASLGSADAGAPHAQAIAQAAASAPELVSRTRHAVDLSARLYGLGVVLYEMATGRPPFAADDPLRLLHAKLADAPQSPRSLRADLPEAFSAIVLRLLEKEPQRRYLSVQGLAHDLMRLKSAVEHGGPGNFALGEADFASRLAAPFLLVGRQTECANLEEVLTQTVRGLRGMVFVRGGAGIGKTSLLQALRGRVEAREGWMVVGKFEQFGGSDAGALSQLLGALGRRLLTESEGVLARDRARIAARLGNKAVAVRAIPEFRLLLGELHEDASSDPAHAEARLAQAVMDVAAAVASPTRPLVLVMEDLQWAQAAALRLLDRMLRSDALPHVMLICTFRDTSLTGTELAARLQAWRALPAPPAEVALHPLPEEEVAVLVSRMLRLPEDRALAFARELSQHTGGNPYNTVEFVNTLRDEGQLAFTASGWDWDASAIRRYVGKANVVDLLAERIARLPAAALGLLRCVACIGHECRFELARAATGMQPEDLAGAARALVDEGLLVEEPAAEPMLCMRHDRAQETVLAMLEAPARQALQLDMARRLAPLAEFAVEAAAQYLASEPLVVDAHECARAAALLRAAAARARELANHANAQQLLDAALRLLDRARAAGAGGGDESMFADCEIELHEALYVLGRLDEADAAFQRIDARETDPLRTAQPASWQIASLFGRGRPAEAITLGVSWLARVGIAAPPAFVRDAVIPDVQGFGEWIAGFDAQRQHAREQASSPQVVAAAKVLSRLGQPAGFAYPWINVWTAVQCRKLWDLHGPSPALAVGIARMGHASCGEFGEWRACHLAMRHMLDFAEEKAWEPECSQIRNIYCSSMGYYEPLERVHELASRALPGLVASGDLYLAFFTHAYMVAAHICSAQNLADVKRGALAARDFALRAGIVHLALMADPVLRLVGLAGGDSQADASAPAEVSPAALERIRQAPFYKWSDGFCGVFACAMNGDLEGLHASSHAPFLKLFEYSLGFPEIMWGRALAAAWRIQAAAARGEEPEPALAAEIHDVIAALRMHAATVPSNFRHLHLHLEAESAWAQGGIVEAYASFDAALDALEGLSRGFFRAFITERFARFQLAQGWSLGGKRLLREAQALYANWGAIAKAEAMAALTGRAARPQASSAFEDPEAPDELDAAALMRASQVLASERNLPTLRMRVEDVLRNIAGATHVQLIEWNAQRNGWDIHDPRSPDAPALDADVAGDLVPLSALRYVQRTLMPLLTLDALADDRFARDPYFRGMERCSLMVVPIMHQGAPLAIIVLENRAARGTFGAARLDAVVLIAGQLAVSLESAKLYENLEEKVAEQTRQLREAQSRLMAEARRSGMAQIATNVLHNVGNLLNSVNVSARVLDDRLRHAPESRLHELAQLLQRPGADLFRYLTEDSRGKVIPRYLEDLSQASVRERETLLEELRRLLTNVAHIQNVVSMQQSYAGVGGVMEVVPLAEVVEDALRLHAEVLERANVQVVRHYGQAAPIAIDKTRVMQVLVNLVDNSCDALADTAHVRRLQIRIDCAEGAASVAVTDNGCGIATDQLRQVFSHGFTTKPGGHGFGLHSCAVAAREMGGSLSVHSDGPGRGATFTLQLPANGHGKAPRPGGTSIG